MYTSDIRISLARRHRRTLIAASNYATSLIQLKRFEEAKSLLRKTLPVARRVLGESHDTTLRMRWNYAAALYKDPGATLDDLREAVTTLEGRPDRAARARRRASAHNAIEAIFARVTSRAERPRRGSITDAAR